MPATPQATATTPIVSLGRSRSEESAYSIDAPEKAVKQATSRLNHERRRFLIAFQAWAGRPRWRSDAASATAPTTNAATAAGTSAADGRAVPPLTPFRATVAATA